VSKEPTFFILNVSHSDTNNFGENHDTVESWRAAGLLDNKIITAFEIIS
jgi:hypothetical protein